MMIWLSLLALAIMVLVMSLAWAVQKRTRNAGWVDAFWSAGTGAAGALCALLPVQGAPPIRAWLVALLALAWAGRLAFYLVRRTIGSAREDVRYARFRQEWGAAFNARMFWFLMVQAAVGALLAICVMLAARNPAHHLRWLDAAAALVLVAALAGETVSDRQMHSFRANPANRGQVCAVGLWGWSRHPNYFFECLGWCAYPIFAFDPSFQWPWGLAALAGPVAMAWLLTKVSGIPPLEREMLQSRPAAYGAYQARVSAFIPLPPKTTPGLKATR
jgi:steroid 5-alpha reductase family enzyme